MPGPISANRHVKSASGIVHIAASGQGRISGQRMFFTACRPLKGMFASATKDRIVTCTKCDPKVASALAKYEAKAKPAKVEGRVHAGYEARRQMAAAKLIAAAEKDFPGTPIRSARLGGKPMLEARCGKCGETFTPATEKDLEHVQRDNGKRCSGKGTLVRAIDQRPAQPKGMPTMLEWQKMLRPAPKGFDVASRKSAAQIKKLTHTVEYDGAFPLLKTQGVGFEWVAYEAADHKSYIAVCYADGPAPKPGHKYMTRTWTHNGDASTMFQAWMHMSTLLAFDCGDAVYAEVYGTGSIK